MALEAKLGEMYNKSCGSHRNQFFSSRPKPGSILQSCSHSIPPTHQATREAVLGFPATLPAAIALPRLSFVSAEAPSHLSMSPAQPLHRSILDAAPPSSIFTHLLPPPSAPRRDTQRMTSFPLSLSSTPPQRPLSHPQPARCGEIPLLLGWCLSSSYLNRSSVLLWTGGLGHGYGAVLSNRTFVSPLSSGKQHEILAMSTKFG